MASSSQNLDAFHQFKDLPTELRLEVWRLTLKSRIVESDLDYGSHLLFGEHNRGLDIRKPRKLPSVFSVNIESRTFCLEQYVPFAGTYIHPSLDILFFSRDEAQRFWLTLPSFSHVPDHPVRRLQKVAIEVEYDREIDFSGHLHWMVGLGCPKELIICPVSSRYTTLDMLGERFQIFAEQEGPDGGDEGNKTHLMEWPRDVDWEMVEEIEPRLRKTVGDEMAALGLPVPTLCKELYFAISEF